MIFKKSCMLGLLGVVSSAIATEGLPASNLDWFKPAPMVNVYGIPSADVFDSLNSTGRHDFSANTIAKDVLTGIKKAGLKEYSDVTAESVKGFIDDVNLPDANEKLNKVLFPYQNDIAPKFSKSDEVTVIMPTSVTGLLAKRLWHISELMRKGYNIVKVYFLTSPELHKVSKDFLLDRTYWRKVIKEIYPQYSGEIDQGLINGFFDGFSEDNTPTHAQFMQGYLDVVTRAGLVDYKVELFSKKEKTEGLMMEFASFAKETNIENVLVESVSSGLRKHVPIARKMAALGINVDVASAGILNRNAELIIHGLDPNDPFALRKKVTNLYKMQANMLKRESERFEEIKAT